MSVVGSLIFYDDNPSSAVVKKKVTKEITYEKIDKDSPIINVYNVSKNKIEKIDIEEYLYGVLSSEMPSTFDEEALKAQAIAARTYVIYKLKNIKVKLPFLHNSQFDLSYHLPPFLL